MGKKKSIKNQRMYRMKGCAKKTCKNYLGGSADANLAYTGNKIPTVPNPFLSYAAKGGALTNSNHLSSSLATNTYNKTLPNTGPTNIKFPNTPANLAGPQKGGCGCGLPLMNGGMKHRSNCKCSYCKTKKGKQTGGNLGIPYPNGLVGSAWAPSAESLPGVDGVQGGRNFLSPNNYNTDVQTSIVSTGAQPPFLYTGKGGNKRTKKQRGGSLTSFLPTDLVNLGRQMQFGVGSAYNAFLGYGAPTNPLPWNNQLRNTTSLSTIKSYAI